MLLFQPNPHFESVSLCDFSEILFFSVLVMTSFYIPRQDKGFRTMCTKYNNFCFLIASGKFGFNPVFSILI